MANTIKITGSLQPHKATPAKKAPVIQQTASVQGHAATTANKVAAISQNYQAAKVRAANDAAAAQVREAAARVAAEAARVREVARVQVQTRLNVTVANTRAQITASVNARPQRSLSTMRPVKTARIVVPDYRTADQKASDEARRVVTEKYAKMTQAPKSGLLGTLVDKVTFGQDRRQSKARAEAEKELQRYGTTTVKKFDDDLNKFLKEQARRAQLVESARVNAKSNAEARRAIDDFSSWESNSISSLNKRAVQFDGSVSALKNIAGAKMTSFASRLAGKTGSFLSDTLAKNPVWKYTLGEGSKNVPSLTTAPGRVVNFVGNINTKNRTIFKVGGTSVNRDGSKDNAWQSTFGQRNFNLKPWTDVKFTPAQAKAKFGQEAEEKARFWAKEAKKRKLKNPEYTDPNYWITAASKGYNIEHRWYNSVAEFGADPLLGVGSLSRAAAKIPKVTKFIDNVLAKSNAVVKGNKVTNWLTAEHKTLDMRRTEFVEQELDDVYNKNPQVRKLLQKYRDNKDTIKLNVKAQVSRDVTDEYAALNRRTAKMFQQYVRAGNNWSGVKKLDDKVLDELNPFTAHTGRVETGRETIERLAVLHRADADALHYLEADKVGTAYRKNYIPQYAKKYNLFRNPKKKKQNGNGAWWFTQKQTKQKIQSKRQLINSLSARRYFSKIARNDLPVLRDVIAGRKDVARNFDRIRDVNTFVKKSRWERAMSPLSLPTKIWKKSVLALRPAWYVNNEIHNQIMGVVSGGLGFIKNQRNTAKYMQHIKEQEQAQSRYAPSKVNAITRGIASNISESAGGGRLAKFASKQENRARIALYRTHRQKGLNHDEALKRTNQYLFNDTTKNWERPLKSVMPFWSFQKNLVKTAARLPGDRPLAAKAYNATADYQEQQFNNDFKKTEKELRTLGYSDAEIDQMREQQRKYTGNRFKVGGIYFSTPFNAFSEKGLTGGGLNPFLSAASESANSVDQYGAKIAGRNATIGSRFLSKFPQAQLAFGGVHAFGIKTGWLKPTESWIGKPGSAGYGLTKSAQGYDPSKPNYRRDLDSGAKFGQDLAAFFGMPRGMEFDTDLFLQRKRMQALKTEYFGVKWKDLDFPTAEAKRNELFKKYGVSSEEFFDGELSKYDTANTTAIKKLKKEAQIANTKLYAEYAAIPKGQRNMRAVEILRDKVGQGYFAKNPFLKSFDWIMPENVGKAQRQRDYLDGKPSAKMVAYKDAVRSGNWSKFNAKYGKNEKVAAYEHAMSTGDWSQYRAKYGTKSTPYQYAGKHFKTAESMQNFITGEFWHNYGMATKADRKKMLDDNPEFNDRKDWTAADWDADRAGRRAERRRKMGQYQGAEALIQRFIASNTAGAAPVIAKRNRARLKSKIIYV